MKKLILSLVLLSAATISMIADDQPRYPGGDAAMKAYIESNTVYPASSKENGVEGIVTVGFIVMPDGSLTQVKPVKMIDPDLEREAVRVVKSMPAWLPAEKNGTPIEAPSQVDVPFILE